MNVLLVSGWLLLAQVDAPVNDLAATVAKLVQQLDAADVATREAAEAALVKLGPDALDHFPTRGASAEVRKSLGRVRKKLELAQAEAFGKASLVTLKGDALPLADALAAFEKQTGNKVFDKRDPDSRSNPKLKLALAKTPFWQAIDEVADQAELTVESFAVHDDEGVRAMVLLTDRLSGSLPRRGVASYSGAFRVAPAQVVATRNLKLKESQSLQVSLEVAWEPRLAPIALKQSLRDVAVLDERGKAVAVDDPSIAVQLPIDVGMTAREIKLPLAPVSRDVKKLSSVKGKFTALVPGRIAEFRFDKLTTAKNVEIQHGGVTVVLNQVRKNNDLWEIRAELQFDENFGELESHLSWLYRSTAVLIGPDKKPIEPATTESHQTERGLGWAYFFDAKGLEGCEFLVKAPAALLTVPVEYELKDIVLP